ncbi:MAG TPA: tRNA epoxyqueuosine(34) reductase QueG [Pyrinomonadaceae bacterium]|nr:tRNA epoxyqueuosine(34) reductase QueG [Pyrinomonadaceae bacterium]
MPLTSASIKQNALELGFQSVGIVAAGALDSEAKHLGEWLARGLHASMSWMENHVDKRGDVHQLMPNARSIIVTTSNYFTPHEHLDTGGKISRYAWGDDYHDVVREKLLALLAWMREQDASVNSKICVDTVPFMDKAWAVRAGLGWLGKHSNLITKDVGSWVFIGSLIVDVELEYDSEIVEDHCGTCTACLDACPTNAIVAPYVVDSAKCISHATIELRDEELPKAVADNIDGWLYGCDICQDVCPWNRFESPTIEDRFEPRNGETTLDPDIVINMSHEKYVGRFRGSAIKRAKLSGLQRNAKYVVK